ncbi:MULTISPECIES: hypothetical protein [Streptomyces]|uniref:hypothetical protein n=1 Tax=Streptomyces TaxID=1883 RepID=UPI0015EF9D6D|nr:hypothetical protein [Streptomyces sp. WAC00263]KAF5991775.1 hypothetical protein BOG92_007675 [Streptomyces sp. WAC00263]
MRTKIAVIAATAITLTGLTIPVASAAVRSASCGKMSIGQPGNVHVWGEYAGQVEQIYDSCADAVSAHWQWSTQFQNDHAGATVTLKISSPYTVASVTTTGWTSSKNVDTGGLAHGIPTPDAWQASATVAGCSDWAKGSLWWYGGQDWGQQHDSWGCN